MTEHSTCSCSEKSTITSEKMWDDHDNSVNLKDLLAEPTALFCGEKILVGQILVLVSRNTNEIRCCLSTVGSKACLCRLGTLQEMTIFGLGVWDMTR